MDKQQTIYFEALTTNRAEGAKALEGFALRGVKNSVVENTLTKHTLYMNYSKMLTMRKQHRHALSCLR